MKSDICYSQPNKINKTYLAKQVQPCDLHLRLPNSQFKRKIVDENGFKTKDKISIQRVSSPILYKTKVNEP